MQGNSGYLTHEMALEQQAEKNDSLSDRFPSVLVNDGSNSVHVFEEDGDWCVWLNPQGGGFTGLCLSVGKTRDEALVEAVKVCEAVTAFLQKPA